MNPQQLQAEAQQAARQGQQQLASYNNQANASTNDYNAQKNQATQANKSLQSYTDYMKGAGSGTNLYNTGLSTAQKMYGFDPATLATATKNLTQSQNAQAALNQASQSSTGGAGLSGAQLGSFYASAAQPLAGQVNAQSTAVGNLTGLANTAQTQANQYAGVGVQGEQATSAALNQVFTNAQAQAQTSADLMHKYSTLAQQQGGLNAQEQQAYDAAINSYQQAKLAIAQSAAAYAQAGMMGAQTAGYNLANQAAQNKAAYTMTPDTHGGFNYFHSGAPITREQYALAG